MKKLAAIGLLSLALQGCSTTTPIITPEQLVQIKAQLPKIEQNKAQICFIRNGSMAPTWKPDVTEDGEKIGELIKNQYFCHNTTSGQHKYVASTTLDYDREIGMNLTNNSRSYVDYTIGMGVLTGNGELKEIDEKQALSEIYEIKN